MHRVDTSGPTRPAALAPIAFLAVVAVVAPPAAAQTALTTADLENLHPREIGPAVTGGRQHNVTADPANPSVLYVASASGGLWKSENRGQSWRNLTDHLPVSTFGDVHLAPSNPQIVYAGTGEENNRQSTSWGNGVYRSDDGGESWRHLGLDGTHHIGRVQVHPTDPDVVYVAALGNLWAPSAERGVYRSRDGGRSWDRVLFIDEHTGAVELQLDPSNPETLYAAMYQRQRRAWGFNGGGPGSGIYKTTDGGENWTELTNGIPEGDKGRIGLALAHSNPQVLNATIEHADIARLAAREDGGATWERVNELNIRPMYYSHVFIDPTNEDRVYVLATSSYRSEDGGRTFTEIAERPTYDVGVHADHHGLWIDPNDPAHLYKVGDAGLHESYDYGVSWRKINNFVTSQFYAIGVDMRTPYRVYGGLQDNHSFAGPSETRRWIGIVNDDWQQTGFGDGMHWQPNPFDTTQAYGTSNGGSYFRLNTLTGDMLDISPQPAPGDEEYRFDWTSPVLASRHDPNTVYVAGNRFFISRDRGSSWTRTDDLSRRIDRDTLAIMGVLGSDIALSRNDGTSSFGEAVTLSESPVDAGVLWVGFDDGNLQVSRDGGATWTEVSRNVQGVPDGTYVSRITASTRGAGVAYAAFDAHRDGDFRPFLYRTDDFGASWTPLHRTLPSGSVLSFAEHPDNPDVLFAGTEHALFASADGGATWAKVPNVPTTAYDDLVIHPREKDLVMGTHGRGIWILDDTSPLAGLAASEGEAAHLFSVQPATIFVYWKDTSYRADAEYAGENPPDGALVTYRLGDGSGPATLRVTNADGQVVRELRVPAEPGMHRVNWDLRWGLESGPEEWERWEHPKLPRPTTSRGPWVSPGTYTLTLEARGTTSSRSVEVRPDPMVPTLTAADYRDRETFMVGLLELRREIQALMQGAQGERQGELRSLLVEVQRVFGSLSGGGVRPGTIHPPTAQHRERIERVRAALAAEG